MAAMSLAPLDPASRLGADLTARRREREQALWRRKRKLGWWALTKPISIRFLVRTALFFLGLSKRAYREFLDVRVVENPVAIPGLPPAFEGFRLLQLTDLHSDLDPALIDRVIELLRVTPFDRAVLTGDFHNEVGTPWNVSLEQTLRLIPFVGAAPLAVLGNHDFLENVRGLEAGGLRVLLNESVALERDGARLWICGVDDAHGFGSHDLTASSVGISADECRLLLSHSPETAWDAAALGYALHLSGHTHGGQLCRPDGRAIVKKAPVPDAMLAGAWTVDGMPGYTSRGTGSCSVAARLNCPPEITVHILQCA